MKKILDKKFFNKPTLEVAENLLGKFLVRKIGNREINAIITEVEAYDGFEDKASHAYRGETLRNSIMFGEAGYWYVYFVYGMHNMLNIVTREKGYPSAVLIRGVEYNGKRINGPGKLTKFLKIGRAFNKKKAEKKTRLWMEDRGVKIKKSQIKRTPRIGVLYAGEEYSKKLYRFLTN